MKRRITLGLLQLVALLPLNVLYVISDVAYIILYYVVRYRVGVVRDNLAKSFPHDSQARLREIERKFYRNFTDNCIETVKLLHISNDEMRRRMQFDNPELIDSLLDSGRSIVVYFAHSFNWEWAPSITLHTAHKPSDKIAFTQVYRPLRDNAIDQIMLKIRSRFGSESIPKATTLRRLLTLRRDGVQSINGFMSDQHPSHGDPGHFTHLLGRPTMMITGTETLARKLNMATVFWDMHRIGRGHYLIHTHLIAENPNDLPQGQITETYTRLLEKSIQRDPALWLWSHKRWKHPANPS